ncbi:hypothetical protein [Mesorhizobium sp. WSM2239]|uniref:Transmembrane protein n=2 Tax=unclassified Mesorhizobium TaxID=325217 RepID=A0AAU8DI13_9HYPH
MQISFVGLLVCVGILVAGHYARATLIVGLLASWAFGSTALMTLSSLGGSSPLIYTSFAALLVMAVAARRRIWRDLGEVFGNVRPVWVLCGLMLYALAGSWLFPRLFADQTSVFVQSPTRAGVVEASLGPVSGNITQTGYFILGGLTCIALSVLLLHKDRIDQVRRGFFVWCCLQAGMGGLDLAGKLAGLGDVLLPIRTASYSMLTEVNEGGFWRIAGAYSEASAFGGYSLACLSFCYVYWRKTKSRLAFWLSAALLILTVLSTSSTAYVALTVLGIPVAFSVMRSLLSGRLGTADMAIIAILAAGLLAALTISLYDQGFFDPFIGMIDAMVINKANSTSGQERAYWNLKSLQAFVDTSSLGIGFGSSRASSWPIAVISQLGLVGSLMMATLLAVVARGMGRLKPYVDRETNAVVSSVQASALAGVVAASFASGTADPGMIFFIALAVISASRVRARRNRRGAMVELHRTWSMFGPGTHDSALAQQPMRLSGSVSR